MHSWSSLCSLSPLFSTHWRSHLHTARHEAGFRRVPLLRAQCRGCPLEAPGRLRGPCPMPAAPQCAIPSSRPAPASSRHCSDPPPPLAHSPPPLAHSPPSLAPPLTAFSHHRLLSPPPLAGAAASPMAAQQPPRRLRLLSLHSFRTSAAIFREQLQRAGLDRELEAMGADLVRVGVRRIHCLLPWPWQGCNPVIPELPARPSLRWPHAARASPPPMPPCPTADVCGRAQRRQRAHPG